MHPGIRGKLPFALVNAVMQPDIRTNGIQQNEARPGRARKPALCVVAFLRCPWTKFLRTRKGGVENCIDARAKRARMRRKLTTTLVPDAGLGQTGGRWNSKQKGQHNEHKRAVRLGPEDHRCVRYHLHRARV